MPELTKKQSQSAATKRRLVAAATRLFADRGYADTSVKAIGDSAGVSQGSIFWHFRSKEGLLFEVVDRAFAEWESEVLAPLLADGPADARAVVDAHLRFVRRNPEIGGRLFFVLVAEALGPCPELRSSYARVYDRFRSYGRRWIEAAIRGGDCRDDVDPDAAAAVMVGALAGITLQWVVGGTTIDLEDAHENLAKVLVRGLAAGDRSGRSYDG